jgi:hypothetical protein
MSNTILIKKFENLIKVIGDADSSSIYHANNKSYLKGSVRLIFNFNNVDYFSNEIQLLEGEFEIAKDGNNYLLLKTTKPLDFIYNASIEVKKNELSPILYFKKILIVTSPSLNISFENISVSISGKPSAEDLTMNRIFFRRSIEPPFLLKTRSNNSGDKGYFLRKTDDRIYLEMKAPSSDMSFSGFKSFNLKIINKSIMRYYFSDSSLEIISPLNRTHLLEFTDESNHQLDVESLGSSFTRVSELTCVDGMISSNKFISEESVVSKIYPGTKHNGERTKLVADSNHIFLHYPMELGSDGENPDNTLNFEGGRYLDVPQLIYKKSFDKNLTVKNKHYGIRLRGLYNDKGVSVKFDTNLAVYKYNPNNSEIYLEAGGKLKTLGGKEDNSIMIPKLNDNKSKLREIKIPCLPAYLRIIGNESRSSFELNTRSKKFTVLNPELEIPPFAPGNLKSRLNTDFDNSLWISKDDKVDFELTVNGLKPYTKDWMTNFEISPDTTSFQLLDSQNSEIIYNYNPESDNIKIKGNGTVITNETGKPEYIAYAGAVVFGATYLAGGLTCESVDPEEIYSCMQKNGKEFINVKFDIIGKNPKEYKKWLINKNVNELQLVLYDDNNKELKKFIDNNIKLKKPENDKQTSYGFWPVTQFIGIPLIKKEPEKNPVYCFDIVSSNFPNAGITSGMAIDINRSAGIDFKKHLGFTEQSFKALAGDEKYKVLFPTYNNLESTNGKIDPTSDKFTGVIFRNMPLILKVPTSNLHKVLDDLLEKINKKLFLEIGWRDEKGFSWIARVPESIIDDQNDDDKYIVDNQLIRFNATKIESIGTESRMLNFSIEIFLGFFNIGENEFKIAIDAKANASFNENGLDNLLITPKSESRGFKDVKDIIPGFDFIRFNKFETDFNKMFAYIELFPNKNLVEALPIFEDYKRNNGDPAVNHRLKTVMAFDFSKEAGTISIIMNSSTSTKLFGKWPVSIKVINIHINKNGKNEVEVVGDFNLGIEVLSKIGGRIVIKHDSEGGWDYDILLDKIGGSIAFSDELKVEGLLSWGNSYPTEYYDNPDNVPPNPLSRDNLAINGNDRAFMGILRVQNQNMFGDFEIFAKTASKNGVPYFIFGLNWNGEINLGIGKLRDPEFLISKNADRNSSIKNMVTNGAMSGLESLRGPNDIEGKTKWLEEFTYSEDTGLTIVASGKLLYNDITEVPKNYSGVLYSSSGLLRIEGYFKIPGIEDEIHVVFAIDMIKKRLLVGFQLPTFYYPTKEKPSLVFQPGQIFFGTNFGGSRYLLVSMGWPPPTGGSSYERDWSKANQAAWYPPSFPMPNMVAAGMKYEYDQENDRIIFGAAIKAGWNDEVDFEVGKAGLEVSLGGILIVEYDMSKAKFALKNYQKNNFITNKLSSGMEVFADSGYKYHDPEIYSSIVDKYNEIRDDLDKAAQSNLHVVGEIFADLRGYATVIIFGVRLAGVYLNAFARLKVCGSTQSGITHIGGSMGATFCVTIGCYTYCKGTVIPITVVGEASSCASKSLNYQYL